MSERTDLEDAVIAWLVAAGASGGVPAGSVVLADQDMPRPALPYMTVRLIVHGIKVHEDEEWTDNSDPPVVSVRGQRRGTVSVNAYGAGAEDWLERAGYQLRYPAIRAQLGDAGLSLEPVGGVNNLSRLRDSGTEVRFQQDFGLSYERVPRVGDTEDATELEVVQHTDDWEGSPDTRTVIVTENL